MFDVYALTRFVLIVMLNSAAASVRMGKVISGVAELAFFSQAVLVHALETVLHCCSFIGSRCVLRETCSPPSPLPDLSARHRGSTRQGGLHPCGGRSPPRLRRQNLAARRAVRLAQQAERAKAEQARALVAATPRRHRARQLPSSRFTRCARCSALDPRLAASSSRIANLAQLADVNSERSRSRLGCFSQHGSHLAGDECVAA